MLRAKGVLVGRQSWLMKRDEGAEERERERVDRLVLLRREDRHTERERRVERR